MGLVILDPAILKTTSPRRQAWFYANVAALREAYRARGGLLLIRSGAPWEVLPALVQELGIQEVYSTLNSTPYARYRDQRVEAALGWKIRWFPGQYIHEPGSLGAYRVYTPYARRWWSRPMGAPLPAPERFPELPPLEEGKLPPFPTPPLLAGETAARQALDRFLSEQLSAYPQARDRLDGSGGSRLSPYFTLGVLSPREAAQLALASGSPGAQKWVAELCWRDFSGDLLYHFPEMTERALDPRFEALPWNDDEELFEAWLEGATGIPVVDGAMRELKSTGFLSNQGRMIAAQFAVKIALLPWQRCEAAFRQLLLDGDRASNLQGWQWAGGLGVDAAPYFRIFNFDHQLEVHDPEGTWRARWVLPHPPRIDWQAGRRRYLELAQRLLAHERVADTRGNAQEEEEDEA